MLDEGLDDDLLLLVLRKALSDSLDSLTDARRRMHATQCPCACSQRADAEIAEEQALLMLKRLGQAIQLIELSQS